jgi:hypothetical protein
MGRPNADLFGCFGNSLYQNFASCFFPCLLYGDLVYTYNQTAKANKNLDLNPAECNSCVSCILYGMCVCAPCIPGPYIRILQGQNGIEACCSYTLCPCCTLLQDLRDLKYLANPSPNGET